MFRLEELRKDDVDRIHLTSLEILERIGIRMPLDKALKLFHNAGADVNFKTGLVRIPPYLVEEAIRSAPERIRMAGRDRRNDYILGDGRIHFGNNDATLINDLETGERRNTIKKDTAEFARFADALENIEWIIQLHATDKPQIIADRHEFEAMVNNTTKNMLAMVWSKEGAKDIIAMASKVVGGLEELRKRPIIFSGICCASPLQYPKEVGLEVLLEMCSNNIPMAVVAEPCVGSTGPCTIAGNIALGNAEILAGITLAQLANKGCPVMHGLGLTHAMDMLTGRALTGCPERALMIAIASQLARRYRIPCWGMAATDSKTLDAQAGYEMMMSILFIMLSRFDSCMGLGLLSDNTIDYAKAIVDDEMVRTGLRIAKGFEIDEESLAFNVIKEVGPGGHFLKHKHTLKHFRKEIQRSKIAERSSLDAWRKAGAKDIAGRARERAKDILKEHEVEPLPKDVQRELREVIRRAEKKALGRKKFRGEKN